MHGFHWNTVYQSFYNICTIYIIIWLKYTSEVQKQHEKIWNPLKFEIFLYKAELTDRNKNKNISQWMEIVDDVCHDWEWILQKKIKVTLKFEIFYIGRRNFQQTHLTWHLNLSSGRFLRIARITTAFRRRIVDILPTFTFLLHKDIFFHSNKHTI